MAPSKQWMKLGEDDRLNVEYEKGVDTFIKYAFERTREKDKIKCPCVKCKNSKFGSNEMVKDHLLTYGIIQSYTFWYHHGERVGEDALLESQSREGGDDDDDDNDMFEVDNEDEMETMLRDFFPSSGVIGQNEMHSSTSSDIPQEPNVNAEKFYRLFEDFQKPLFEGSNSSRLSAIINLLHIKTLGRWSNESFTMLLQFLKSQVLPKESTLPDCYYDAKKSVKDLGLSYKKIDACVNDCMLFWKDDEGLENCKICNASRWKQGKHSGEARTKENGKRIPQKGGKEGNTPPISAVFKRTRKGKSGSLAQAEAAKYDEIIAVKQDNPSLSHFDVVEKCFREQDRGSVVCFGFGVRPKDVRGPLPSRSELTASLHEKQRENDDLRKRMDEMDKTRQEEREADRTKISALEENFDILMRAYLQRSNGGDQLNSNIN